MAKGKKRINLPKPRKTEISIPITIEKPTTVHLEIKNSDIRLYDDNHEPIKINQPKMIISRERASSNKKGNKEILRLPLHLTEDNQISITDRYDAIYAVDTNSQLKNGLFFSEGALAKLESISQKNEGNIAELSVERLLTVYGLQEEHKEQRIWLLAIRLILEREPATAKIALVVDCDLGKIDQYNQRNIKIANQEYLPKNITLIYASSDNKDTIYNLMISQCDAVASRNLKERLQGVVPQSQF